MTASSMPPANNLLVLAVVGIGAYWFLSRRAVAAPAPAAVAGAQTGGVVSVLGQVLSGLGLVSKVASSLPSLASSGVDGVAFNPPTSSPFDFATANTGTFDDANELGPQPVDTSSFDYANELGSFGG